MQMLTRHRELLTKLVQKLGSNEIKTVEVWNIEQTEAEFRGATALVRKYGNQISRGTYKLELGETSTDREQAEEAVEETSTKEVELEMTTTATVRKLPVREVMAAAVSNYIPKKNSNYVKFGFYDDMKTIIRSGEFAPTYIVGESGNGKTMTVFQVCAELERECIPVNITNETCEEDLIGHQTLRDGNLEWKDGPALIAMRRGAVLLLDELDQGTSRLLCLQTILQSHSYYNKKTGEMIHAAPGFTVVATGNTRGDGVGQDVYIGAQLMNEAFMDRFSISFEHQYPTEAVERRILGKLMDEEQIIERLVSWAHSTRRTKATGAINHSITTRRLTQIAANFRIFKDSKKAIKMAVARYDEKHRLAFEQLWEKMQDDTPAATTAAP